MPPSMSVHSNLLSDKACAQEKKRIMRHLEPWVERLGLKWWSIDVSYSISDQSDAYQDGKGRAVAFTSANWQYLSGEIVFFMPLTIGLDEEELDEACRHECCHFILNVTRPEWNIKHEELAATLLTNAFLFTFEAGKEEGLRLPKKKGKK